MGVDVLAIGAHPDDVELSIGGTITKLTARGKSVVLLDLTRGEMGSRGSAEIRKEEAECAARILGVKERITLDLGDGMLEDNVESRRQVMEAVRKFCPAIIFTGYWDDLHPDHAASGRIVRSTIYPSGFAKYPAAGEPYRANEVLFFMGHTVFVPSFIVDITGYHEKKVEAMKCYASQLYREGSAGPVTNISQPDFITRLEARARHYGNMINTEFGEPFLTVRAVPVDDPVEHYAPFPKR